MKRVKNPLVTVLFTVYNEERYIEEALSSIMRQTYRRLEIVVVDDGSTDRTPMIVKQLQAQDPRIKLILLKKNVGPSEASNVGIAAARGRYLARMDGDDIATPQRIETQVRFLQAHPGTVVVGGQCYLMDDQGRRFSEKQYPTTHEEIYRSLFIMNPILHPTCMINRKLLPGGMISYHNYSLLAHDLELIYELAQYGALANVPTVVLSYRQHEDSLSLSNPKTTFQATVEIRHKAVRAYGYVPDFKGWCTHLAQRVVVFCLPQASIYPLFHLWRLPEKMWVSLRERRLLSPLALVRRNVISYMI